MKLNLDQLKKLHQKKYRQEFGFFLAEGEHLVLELIKASENNPLLLDSELFMTGGFPAPDTGMKVNLLTERQLSQIADTRNPQGIFATVPLRALQHNSQNEQTEVAGKRSIYLHEIQDPGNLGTILRTLAWFGNFQCLLSPGSVDPFNPKVVRASMGAIFHVPIVLDARPEELSASHSNIACLDLSGESLGSPGFQKADCLVFGNEARGVPADIVSTLQAERYSIPGAGNIDSLNLATTVNICVYELNRGSCL